jgi:aspartate-semialdehyde dehydrogenase
MSRKFKVGLVGATGMVGKVFVQLLKERNFPLAELRPFASDNSQGKKIELQGQQWEIQTLKPNCFDGLDMVFFSSGDDISKDWAPQAVRAGAYVIDNSAAFRMDNEVPLVVPEVNWEPELLKKPCIIANPNCTTIQLVVALKPLRDAFGLEDVKVSSYQAVSGAGQAGYDELMFQTQNYQSELKPQTFSRQILFNCIPQIGSFNEQGYTSEEMKVVNETKKILGEAQLRVSAFTVRVPVLNAHSESIWVTFKKQTSHKEVIEALKQGEGLVVCDKHEAFPTALEVSGKDPVYVGRVHQDLNDSRIWLLWVVADNLKKGAALNGIQIAEKLISGPAKI